MTAPAPPTAAIADLVPHAGTMVLLGAVDYWDDERIICSATSHASTDNPLRRDDGLPAVCGAEYGAQAMAVHGGLLNGPDAAGMLVSLRDISVSVDRLDGVPGPLEVEATVRLRDGDWRIYGFSVRGDGCDLITGQAMVFVGAVGMERGSA